MGLIDEAFEGVYWEFGMRSWGGFGGFLGDGAAEVGGGIRRGVEGENGGGGGGGEVVFSGENGGGERQR